MVDDETKQGIQDLIHQIQEKSVQLSDLEVIMEDYQHERRELLREISKLKASLWELSTGTELPPYLRHTVDPAADNQTS